MSRPRSGPRRPLAAPPIASTARAGAHRRRRRSAPRPRPAPSRSARTGEDSKISTPARQQPLAQAERQPRRLHRRRARGRRRRRGRPARRSAPPPRSATSACDRVGHAELAAGGERLAPRRRRGPARSRPAGSRPGGTRRRPPPRSQKAPIPPTASLGGAGDRQRRLRRPSARRMFGSENHIALQKPPLRPLGPVAADRLGLEQDDPRLGLQLLQVPGGPEPGVAAADDDHVGLALAGQRRRRLDRPGLLQPVAVCACAPSPPQCRRPAPRSAGVDSTRWPIASQDSTPYVDALLAYAELDPGPLPGPRPQGRRRRRPGDARAGRRGRPAQRHPLGHRGRRHRPRTDPVPAGAAARRRGLGRAAAPGSWSTAPRRATTRPAWRSPTAATGSSSSATSTPR